MGRSPSLGMADLSQNYGRSAASVTIHASVQWETLRIRQNGFWLARMLNL